MIMVNYKCEQCNGEKGHLDVNAGEPVIICDTEGCGEIEPIKDFDILGNE